MGQGYCFCEPIQGTAISNFASSYYQSKFGNGAYILIPRANEDLGLLDTTFRFMYTISWVVGHDDYGTSNQLPELLAAIRNFLEEEEKV